MKFLPLLGLLFIGLKLTEVISWSWWLVLLPIYVPAILGLIALLISIGVLATLFKK